MGEVTGIQWTDHTFNPWIGCHRVSPACDHCYAEQGSRRLGAQHGLKLWEGDRYFTGTEYWKQPHMWNRAAAKAGVRGRVFCASYADVFEGRTDFDASREGLFNVIEQTPWLDWQLLTKRPQNIRSMLPAEWLKSPRPNVWLGATMESQEYLDLRAPQLLDVPAVCHFISAEPLLGPIDLRGFRPAWLIIGGESGTSARPIDPVWVRSLIEQCRANVFTRPFVKQMGRRIAGPHDGFSVNRWILEDWGNEWTPPIIGELAYVRPENAIGFTLFDGHGGDWNEWPADLRVREWPEVRS